MDKNLKKIKRELNCWSLLASTSRVLSALLFGLSISWFLLAVLTLDYHSFLVSRDYIVGGSILVLMCQVTYWLISTVGLSTKFSENVGDEDGFYILRNTNPFNSQKFKIIFGAALGGAYLPQRLLFVFNYSNNEFPVHTAFDIARKVLYYDHWVESVTSFGGVLFATVVMTVLGCWSTWRLNNILFKNKDSWAELLPGDAEVFRSVISSSSHEFDTNNIKNLLLDERVRDAVKVVGVRRTERRSDNYDSIYIEAQATFETLDGLYLSNVTFSGSMEKDETLTSNSTATKKDDKPSPSKIDTESQKKTKTILESDPVVVDVPDPIDPELSEKVLHSLNKRKKYRNRIFR